MSSDFWERADDSVSRMFSREMICLFVSLVISNFDYEGRIVNVSSPGHCLSFTCLLFS